MSMQQMFLAMKAADSGAIVNPLTPVNGNYSSTGIGSGSTTRLRVKTDGNVTIRGGQIDQNSLGTGQWFNPATGTPGNSYWVKFTRTAFSPGVTGTATTTTGWLALSSEQSCYVSCTDDNGFADEATATFTVEIASDSGGTNVVSSRAGYILTAAS